MAEASCSSYQICCTWRNGNQQKMFPCLSLSDLLVCLIYQSATDLWNEGRGSRGLRGGEDGRNSFILTIYHRGRVSTKRCDGRRTVPSFCFLLSDLLRTSYRPSQNLKMSEEREELSKVIRQWNSSRLDLFEISQPDEVSPSQTNCQNQNVLNASMSTGNASAATKH